MDIDDLPEGKYHDLIHTAIEVLEDAELENHDIVAMLLHAAIEIHINNGGKEKDLIKAMKMMYNLIFEELMEISLKDANEIQN